MASKLHGVTQTTQENSYQLLSLNDILNFASFSFINTSLGSYVNVNLISQVVNLRLETEYFSNEN